MEAVQKNIHADIIKQCLHGDRQAQNELYKLYSKAMYNICYRMTNDRDEAEDVLQEAFISAFGNLGSFRGTASFGAWLKRIVVNKGINYLRKKQLDLVPIDEQGQEVPEDSDYDEDDLILEIEAVKQAVQQLPDGYRLVFSLYLMEGYDHQEIAKILNITESTSKSQYLRAKRKLREILKSRAYETG